MDWENVQHLIADLENRKISLVFISLVQYYLKQMRHTVKVFLIHR